jgi:pimeloyl-ACP methyl ester carboxylesterase
MAMQRDFTIKNTTVDGVFVEFVGEIDPAGRSLVFVHGGCHASWCWRNYLGYFAGRGWNCFTLDWYGHGRSRQLAPEELARRSIAEVVHEIHRAVELSGTCPIIIGHSMGALASQCYAARHDVAGLVLLAPTAPQEVGNASVPIPVDPEVPWGPPPFDVAKQMFFVGFNDSLARSYHALLGPESAQAILEVTGRAGVSVGADDIRDRTTRILVVAAENDALAPPNVTARIANYYQAEYHLLAGQGHDGLLLGPAWREAANLVAAFTER